MKTSEHTTPVIVMTARRRAVLRAMETLQRAGKPVTVRKIGELADLSAPSSVHNQLSILVRGGFVAATRLAGTNPRHEYSLTDSGRAEMSSVP